MVHVLLQLPRMIYSYVVIMGELCEPRQLFLEAEEHVLCEVRAEDLPSALLGAHYVFNTRYQDSCASLYTAMEVMLLGKTSGKNDSLCVKCSY